jgi:hypothetical protein
VAKPGTLRVAAEGPARRGNDRVHRVTREKPCDRFEVERKELRPIREYDVVLESTRVADSYGLVSVNGVRYSVPAEFARRPVTVQCRPATVTFLADGTTIVSHRNALYGVRLVQLDAHLPPKPKPQHERFVQLGTSIVDRYGAIGSQYVELVEKKAPHAPLAILREVLDRHEEYGSLTVCGALASLVQFSIVKRGMLSTLCQRFGGTPKVVDAAHCAFPHIDVERRSLAVYDEVAA